MKDSRIATPRCPGTLKEGHHTYSIATQRNLFSGRKVLHILPDNFVPALWQSAIFNQKLFPGQRWYKLKLEKNKLIPDTNGSYLLKTFITGKSGWRFEMEQPANEHLCQQIAAQIFNLKTLPNALIFFPNGKPAILYKFFPSMNSFVSFKQLLTRTEETQPDGITYYSQIMDEIDKVCAASATVKDRYFYRLLVSWLIGCTYGSTETAGLVKSERGDLIDAPVEGLFNANVHFDNAEIGLSGLFEGDRHTPQFREYGHYTRNEFEAFGRRSGIRIDRLKKIFDEVNSKKNEVMNLISLAFLPEEAKTIFRNKIMENYSRLL